MANVNQTRVKSKWGVCLSFLALLGSSPSDVLFCINVIDRHRIMLKQQWCSRVAVVLSSLVLCISNIAVAQLPEELFARMPRSTVAAIVTDEVKNLRDHISQTGVVSAVKRPAFEPFRSALEERLGASRPWLPDFPLPWSESEKLLSNRRLALTIVETGDQGSELCYLVEAGPDLSRWLALVNTYLASASEMGAAIQQKAVSGGDLWLVTPSNDSGSVSILHTGEYLVFGKTAACMLQWLRLAVGSGVNPPALIRDQRYLQTIDQLSTKFGKRGDVWFFVDPLRLAYLSGLADGSSLRSFSETFVARHGFDAVKACGGLAAFGSTQYDASYRARIWAPAPHGRGMQLLRWQPMDDPSPSPWVPRSVSSYAMMNWDLQPILKNVGLIVDDIIHETTGKSDSTFETLLAEIRSEKGLGVDIESDFMPLLGNRVEFISVFTPTASETAEQSIIAIEVSDDAEVADLLYSLLEGDSNNFPLSVPGFTFDLWRLGIGRRAGDRGPSFSTPGVMVAHNRLFIASSYLALREYVAVTGQQTSIEHDPQYRELAAKISLAAGDRPAMRVIAYPARGLKKAFELLRTGRGDNAQSLYTVLFQALLQSTGTELPFKLLPSFDAIEGDLGPMCIQLNVVEDGLDLWGMNLRAKSAAFRTPER